MTLERKTKPFPWRCPRCLGHEVRPATIEYTSHVKHDGRLHEVAVRELVVPKCPACGELVFCNDTEEQISRALRHKLRLLQPDEIRSGRKALDLTQNALAKLIGVAQETISRWESGLVIQTRAMDTLVRIFFGFPDVRDALGAGPKDSETAGNWFDWTSAGAALYAPFTSTGVFVNPIMQPAPIFDEHAQAITVPEDLLGWQWPINGDDSYEATTIDEVPGESSPRIAA